MNANTMTKAQFDDIKRYCRDTGLSICKDAIYLDLHGYLEGYSLSVEYFRDTETFDIELTDNRGKTVFDLEDVRKDFIGKYFS